MSTSFEIRTTPTLPGAPILSRLRRTIVVTAVAAVAYGAFMTAGKGGCAGGVSADGGFLDAQGHAVDAAPMCVNMTLHANPFMYAFFIGAIDRFRGAPLIKPILYKTVFYGLVVTLLRVIEQFIHFSFDSDGFSVALREALDAFTWRRFTAIQIWLFTCFLLYVTTTELSAALGAGKLKQLVFGPRDG